MSTPTRVAVYFRMSTSKQENSIPRQQELVFNFCKLHGYIVAQEYLDAGISGTELARRPQFRKMLQDAQAGLFDGIVCDDADRFGRFDVIDSGEIIAPLRRAGIWLETVAQNRIDWESFGGRISAAIIQEAKNMEQEANSRRALTGMIRAAQMGKRNGGRTLFGYRKDADDVSIPDEKTAATVRWIFEEIASGHTLGEVSDGLYRRGILSPGGKPRWSRQRLRKLVTNPGYLGIQTWGRTSQGIRNRHLGGELVPVQRGAKKTIENEASDWIIMPSTHEPLVTRDVFDRCQERMKENKSRTSPHRGRSPFLLSGLLVCGHCQKPMVGWSRFPKPLYVCGTYHDSGGRSCRRNSLREEPLVGELLRRLKQVYLTPEGLANLRSEVARQER